MRRQWIVLLGVLLVLTACGSPQAQRAHQEEASELAAAAAASADAGAVRFVMRGVQQMEASDEPMRMKGFGVADPVTQRMKMFLHLGSSPLTGDLGAMEAVGEGLVIYMKWPFMNSLIPPSEDVRPWLKMDLEAIGDELGLDMGALMQMQGGGQNPSDMLTYLYGTSEIREVGSEKIHGVPTTHVRAVVDLRGVAESAPADVRERVAATIDRLIELTGQDSMPLDVWVDDDDLVRRLKMVNDFTEVDPALGMPPTETTYVMDFVEYGIHPRIKMPPASQVTDMLELIEDSEGATT